MRSTDARKPTIDTKRGGPNAEAPEYLVVGELRSDTDTDTCLRPLGLCELGGACEACWYRPDHPRFQK